MLGRRMVYLCGPITGLTAEEAGLWRRVASDGFAAYGIGTFDPMSVEEHKIDGVISGEAVYDHMGPLMTGGGIYYRDKAWVHASDLVLANFQGAQRVSIGSVKELGWAEAWNKPVVIIPDSVYHKHLFMQRGVVAECKDIDEAVECSLKLLGV
jgi:nucleoside 2-deoxyribosyltransferase